MFSEAVNLLLPDDFTLTLVTADDSEEIVPESIELDSSNTKLIFKLKIEKIHVISRKLHTNKG